MDSLIDLLGGASVALRLGGHAMTWLEVWATALYFASVLLAIRPHVWTWPTGIAANVLLLALFYQIHLYSDMLLQIYYIAISVYGLWLWRRGSDREPVRLGRLTLRQRALLASGALLAILTLGAAATHFHVWMPTVFEHPAAYPFADAATTVLSVVATVLLARKRVETWILWLAVDVVCVFLYVSRGVLLMAAEYAVFLAMASAGLYRWHVLLAGGSSAAER